MAPDAADGEELRPPSPGRPCNAAGWPEQAAASQVMSPASSTPRTAAWRANRLARSYGGTAVSRSELAGTELHTPGDASRPGMDDRASQVRHACTRFRGETGQDDHLHNATRLCAWAGSKGAGSGRSKKWSWGRGAGTSISYQPRRAVGGTAYIILAAPDARPASCGLRLAGERRGRHGEAWRTSLPHCTWSPRCPWPDRK